MNDEKPAGSFSSLLSRSVDKLSGQGVRLKQFVTGSDPADTNNGAVVDAERKKHRRAQVRKAQIEHRQRKESHVRSLEQEVAQLRELTAAVETQTTILEVDNAAIRAALTASNVPLPTIDYSEIHVPREQISSSEALTPSDQCTSSKLRSSPYASRTSPGDVTAHAVVPQTQGQIPRRVWQSSESPSPAEPVTSTFQISMRFDDLLEVPRLHVSSTTTTAPYIDVQFDLNPLFHDPENFNTKNPIDAPSFMENDRSIDPTLISSSLSARAQPQPDLATIAINFILALEHVCREHFYLHSQEFQYDEEHDYEGANGHEMMASAFIYSHAPDNVYSDREHAQWTVPTLQLSDLYAMSQSLEKDLLEITPVQAWFTLLENYDISDLLKDGKLDIIKLGLAELTRCVYYGAALDLEKFWRVVVGVMGDASSYEAVTRKSTGMERV